MYNNNSAKNHKECVEYKQSIVEGVENLKRIEEEPQREWKILDIGTGTGLVALMLAQRKPSLQIDAIEIDADAAQQAQDNIAKSPWPHIQVHCTPLQTYQPTTRYQLIVSNPPYIKQCERLQMERNVLDWEPELALFVPDDDPLLFYRTIVRRAANGLLKPGGRLYFEINREHGADTIALMEEAGFVQVELLKDLSGNERIVKGGLV